MSKIRYIKSLEFRFLVDYIRKKQLSVPIFDMDTDMGDIKTLVKNYVRNFFCFATVVKKLRKNILYGTPPDQLNPFTEYLPIFYIYSRDRGTTFFQLS